jgi:hypothetical protein
MNGLVRFRIQAHARSGLTISGTSMDVEASLAHFGDALVPVVARKMAGFVGVETVILESEQLEMA